MILGLGLLQSYYYLYPTLNKEVCDVLDFFLTFLNKHEKGKTHNMMSMILDPRHMSLHLVFSFIGHE
jgi:hypothetical protein